MILRSLFVCLRRPRLHARGPEERSRPRFRRRPKSREETPKEGNAAMPRCNNMRVRRTKSKAQFERRFKETPTPGNGAIAIFADGAGEAGGKAARLWRGGARIKRPPALRQAAQV